MANWNDYESTTIQSPLDIRKNRASNDAGYANIFLYFICFIVGSYFLVWFLYKGLYFLIVIEFIAIFLIIYYVKKSINRDLNKVLLMGDH